MGTTLADDFGCTLEDLLGASSGATPQPQDVIGASQMGGAPLDPTQATQEGEQQGRPVRATGSPDRFTFPTDQVRPRKVRRRRPRPADADADAQE